MDRVEKRLVFRRLQNPPLSSWRNGTLHQRQNPRRRHVFQGTERSAGETSPERATPRWRMELRSPQEPALIVPQHHLRARGIARIRTCQGKAAAMTKARRRGEEYLLERRIAAFASYRRSHPEALAALFVSDVLALRCLARSRLSARGRDQTGWPASDAIEVVVERRHQNGRWPLNLRHSEYIPLETESDVGRASRWNTLRALRVLRWFSNSTWRL